MTEVPPAERELLAGAERRLGHIILALAVLGTVTAAWRWEARLAAAFALGGGLAYLNYRWLVAIVETLVSAGKAKISKRTYLKLFSPLILLAVLLYVIFSRSLLPGAGVLFGLLILVPAVALEAIYEVILAVCR